jgi:hypothetical protein
MKFNEFVCNNCENEKEDRDSFLFFEGKDSKELIKNKNTNVNKKSLLSSSDNNNSTNNILEIIEYPYIYNCDENEDDNPDPTPGIGDENNSKKNDNNINEPQYREPQYREPQYKEPEYKEPQYREPQYREPEYKEPQYREPQYREPQYREPQYKESQCKETNVNEEQKKCNHFVENNNSMIKNKEFHNFSHNKKNSKESSSLINIEDTLIQNKVLLTDYYSNMNNKILSTESIHENNNLNTSEDKKIDTISNNIQNISEIKVQCPKPDTNIITKEKYNNNLVNEVKKVTHKKEEKGSMKAIKVKRKVFNDKKILKNINNNRFGINKDKKQILKNSPITVNVQNKNHKYTKKIVNFNKNKNIRKKISNVNTEKIIVRKKLTESKLSSKTNELIFSYKNIEKSSFSTNNLKKSEQSIINLSKNRVRYLSHTYFGKMLINKSTNRNTFSNLTEKKKNSYLNSSENFKYSSNYSLNSSKTYINPFAQLYDRKKRNFLY